MSYAAAIAAPDTINKILLIGRGVWIETLRRKDFYVLLILMFFFIAGALIVSLIGVENASTSNFLFNLGLTFAYMAAHLLTLLSAARQVPADMEFRTIYPLLAKPVERRHYLIGKWLAASAIGCSVLVLLLIMVRAAWLFIPRGHELNALLFWQALILQFFSIAFIGALGIVGSIILPQGINVVLMAILLMNGDRIIGFIRARALDGAGETIVRWVSSYIPNFGNLNLINRYTDGVGPLGVGEFLGLVLYAVIFTSVILATGHLIFNRKAL